MLLLAHKGGLPVDDAVKVVTPNRNGFGDSGRDMTEQVNLLAKVFSLLQLLHEPLELTTRVHRVQQQQPVYTERWLLTIGDCYDCYSNAKLCENVIMNNRVWSSLRFD